MLPPARFRRAGLLGLGLLWLMLLAADVRAQAPLHYVNDDTRIRGVSFKFVGSQTFDEDVLRAQIAVRGPGFGDRVRKILPFTSAKVYPFDPVELQKDVVRLRRFYQRNGYLEPRIDYPVSQLDTTNNAIRIIFTIDEGPPLIIQDFGFFAPSGGYAVSQFEGALERKWVDFRDGLALQVGTRYTEVERVRIHDQVLTWLQNEGYAFADVRTRATVDSSAHTVDLRFETDPGPRAYVSEIVVEGTDAVSPDVVRRELPFGVGDRFSAAKMARGQRELFGLNLFRAALADLPEQPRDSTVVVRYRVREADLRTITAQTGFGSESGVLGEATWRHRNFLGGARELVLNAELLTGFGAQQATTVGSAQRLSLTATLRQPYLFTTHLSGTIKPLYRNVVEPDLNVRFQEARIETDLLYQIYTYRTVSLGFTFGRVFGDLGGIPESAAEAPVDNRDIFNRATFRLNAQLGDLDNFLRPTRGLVVRPFAEVAGSVIASDVAYYKTGSEILAFVPLGRRKNVRARLYGGRLWPLGKSVDQDDPLNEFRFDDIRFYAGGADDVRGWLPKQLGPQRIIVSDTLFDDTGAPRRYDDGTLQRTSRYEAEGGLSKLAASLEFRLPFPGLGPKWQAAAFVDMGQVFESGRDVQDDPVLEPPPTTFSLNKLRYAVGSGFRYETLVGFLRLDVAYKLNPSLSDLYTAETVRRVRAGLLDRDALEDKLLARFRIHLSIGQTF